MTVKQSDNTEKKKKSKKALIIVLSAIAAVLVLVLSTFFVLRSLGKRQLLSTDTASIIETVSEAVFFDDNTVSYGGKTYRYNENVTAFLCMGIDRENIFSEEDGGNSGTGPNADTLFLVTLDISTGKTVVTAIPRDAMTDVDVYSVTGKYLGVKEAQICTAYSYGDGKEKSCEYAVSAVSRFLYGMPVNSYIAIDYTAIEKLTDSIGGVEVTCNETFSNTSGSRSYKKGELLKLTGENVLTFLRDRNQATVNSSTLRRERQTEYLKNFSSAAIAKTKKDLGLPIRLYNLINKESVSNIGSSKITYLTTELFGKRSGISVSFRGIDGTETVGADEHIEFRADEKALFETVLDLYYTPEEAPEE